MLNRVLGEAVPHFKGPHRIVPTRKWLDSEMGKRIWTLAQESFGQSGAILPVSFEEDEILVQEYPEHPGVVVMFAKEIGGRELFYACPITFSPVTIRELKKVGMWDDPELRN